MLNCRQATLKISQSQERQLTKREKFELKFHKLLCGGCRNFEVHIQSLRKISKEYAKGYESSDSLTKTDLE